MVRSKRFILPLRSSDLFWKTMDSQAMIVLFSRLLRLRACGKKLSGFFCSNASVRPVAWRGHLTTGTIA